MSQQGYDYELATDGGSASEDCGGTDGVVRCTAAGAAKGTCS